VAVVLIDKPADLAGYQGFTSLGGHQRERSVRMSNPLNVGIDVHSQTNRTCLMDHDGEQWGRRFSTANNRPGTQTLIARLAEAMYSGQFDSLRVAVEATNWYWWPLLQRLSQDPVLARWPHQFYALNPRVTAKYKESFPDKDKSDDDDAYVAADRLRTYSRKDLPAPFAPDLPHLGLRFLTRYRYHLVKDLVREKNYCLGVLYLKASEYRTEHPFSDVFGATSRALIEEFASFEEVVAMPLTELATWLDTQGKGRFPDPAKVARELQQVAQDSYPLDQPLQQPVNYILTWSFQMVNFLERQLTRVNTAITEAMRDFPNTLTTIPGFGPVYSAGIIAEIGDLARFNHDEAKVAQFAGLHWRKHESGQSKAEDTYLTKRGNAYLRYYFCEAANAVRVRDAGYAAYYQRKHDEVRSHQHRRAVVLTARKLVRLVVRLLTTNQPYQLRRQPGG
jgi:transposase